MRILIAEDHLASRVLLSSYFDKIGQSSDTVENGLEAVKAFTSALDENKPYKLICLDIMMPKMNGQEALKQIRQLETDCGISEQDRSIVLMISALSNSDNILDAFREQCDGFILKPITEETLIGELKKLNLIDG